MNYTVIDTINLPEFLYGKIKTEYVRITVKEDYILLTPIEDESDCQKDCVTP